MVADKDQFKAALKRVRDDGHLRNTKYVDMLKAQYAADGHAITATQLAKAVGFQNYNAANLQYGTFASLVAKALGFTPPIGTEDEPKWWFTLSTGIEASDKTMDGHFEFVMRPELISALEEMRWVKPVA